jgi:membrane fusion protein, multidrug efflux system
MFSTTTIKSLMHNKKILFISMCCLIIIFGASSWWFYTAKYVSTDDAYVNANVVEIAPRISGQITKLYVTNNQHVKRGQLLFEVDRQPFQAELNKIDAELAMAAAELDHAKVTNNRTEVLVKQKVLPVQSHDDAVAKVTNAVAGVNLIKASFDEAKLNMQYTRVYAPTSGFITNMTLRIGSVITINQPLFALVNDEEFWVDTNFKETELTNVRPGQNAIVKVDMYPKHIFHGVVASISSGSGAVFSLLPPQNATGNWVKITQRVPVKIRIVDPNISYPLRIGTTATVTVDTKKT